MKNILFIDVEGGRGGASNSLFTFIKQLNREIFNSFLLICKEGPIIEEYRKLGIEVVKSPLSLFNYQAISKDNFLILFLRFISMVLRIPGTLICLKRIIDEKKIEIIHINSIVILPTAVFCTLMFKLPIIYTIREILANDILGRVQRKLLLWTSDKIIAISENEARQFNEGAKDNKIIVRYNPVDIQSFQYCDDDRTAIRRQLHISDSTVVISTIGAIVALKGQDRIIDIVEGIKGKHKKKVKFLIVGKIPFIKKKGFLERFMRISLSERKIDEFQKRIENMIVSSDLQEYVSIIKHTKDISKILSASDIILRTSRLNDPWGRDIIEAMVNGRSIIATGIYNRLIEDNKNGFLIPPQKHEDETIEKIVEKILLLVNDPNLMEFMGKNNAEKGRLLFDSREYARFMEGLYCQAVG